MGQQKELPSPQQITKPINEATERMLTALDANPGYVANALAGIEAGRKRALDTLNEAPPLSLHEALRLRAAKQLSQEDFYAHLIAGLPSNQQKKK